MKYIVFDIETGTNSKAEQFIPEFDVEDVKIGNLVDEEKIKKKIAQAKAIYYKTTLEKAPLSAVTGKVLTIGYLKQPENIFWQDYIDPDREIDEFAIISAFWEVVKEAVKKRCKLVGQEIKNFDLPFLYQRSWILGITPVNLFSIFKEGTFDSFFITDIKDLWRVNMFKTNSPIGNVIHENSLATIAKALNVGYKSDDGKSYEKIFQKDLTRALEYNKEDVLMTDLIYKKLTTMEDVRNVMNNPTEAQQDFLNSILGIEKEDKQE